METKKPRPKSSKKSGTKSGSPPPNLRNGNGVKSGTGKVATKKGGGTIKNGAKKTGAPPKKGNTMKNGAKGGATMKKAGGANVKKAGANKAGAKKKGPNRRIDFCLHDLNLLDTSDITLNPTRTTHAVESTFVVKTMDEIIQMKDNVCVFGMSSMRDKAARPIGYFLLLRELKKQIKQRYVLTNIYWWVTPTRRKEQYDFKNRMDYSRMVQNMPNIVPRDYTKHAHVDEALVFRALFKNKACKKSIYELFKGKQGTIKYDDSGLVQGVHVGEVFDLGYFYEVMHIKRDLDFTKPPKFRTYNTFLKRRGFPENGRMIMPTYLYDGDTEPRYYGRKEHRWYTENFDNVGWTLEDIKRKRLNEIQPLLKFFPHKTKGKLKMVQDVWISRVGQRHMFELFSSKLHFDFKKELSKLHLIPGKDDRQVYLSLFLCCLALGYCDLHTFETVYAVQQYIRSKESWFGKGTFDKDTSGKDDKTYKLKCCDNENHHIRMGPYRHHVEFRRCVYINTDSDGECCYRWMMKSCLPELKIEN